MNNRGVSEIVGVGVLVGMVVVIVVSLGFTVLLGFGQEQDPGDANLSFNKIGDSLVITYNDNYKRTAESVYIDGPDNNVTWAQLSDQVAEEETIPSGSRVQLGESGEYGYPVGESDSIEVAYIADGNRYVLATWGGSDASDEIDVGNPTG